MTESRDRAPSNRFDEGYYKRWYRSPSTKTFADKTTPVIAEFLAGYLAYHELPIRSILDVGSGLGFWRDACRTVFPNAEYLGLEISEYAVQRFGWRHGSIVDFDPGQTFDLIICQGVLQYLGARDAEAAIGNIARLCSGALYLEVLTRRDLEEVCIKKRTDSDVHLRSGAWYLKRLRPDFVGCGGGMFLSRNLTTAHYEISVQWL